MEEPDAAHEALELRAGERNGRGKQPLVEQHQTAECVFERKKPQLEGRHETLSGGGYQRGNMMLDRCLKLRGAVHAVMEFVVGHSCGASARRKVLERLADPAIVRLARWVVSFMGMYRTSTRSCHTGALGGLLNGLLGPP